MIEVDLPNGRTIHAPDRDTAEWCVGHIHHTLNNLEWREVEERPDSDGPTLMSPNATAKDGRVLYQDGQALMFESLSVLTYYVRSLAESYPGDVDDLRESLESPHVTVADHLP